MAFETLPDDATDLAAWLSSAHDEPRQFCELELQLCELEGEGAGEGTRPLPLDAPFPFSCAIDASKSL